MCNNNSLHAFFFQTETQPHVIWRGRWSFSPIKGTSISARANDECNPLESNTSAQISSSGFVILGCRLLSCCSKWHTATSASAISLRNLQLKQQKNLPSVFARWFFFFFFYYRYIWSGIIEIPVLLDVVLWRVCFFLRSIFSFTVAPSFCSSGRDELSKPSCCRAMRVSSWRWSASAWASLVQSISAWIGWMVACTP